METRNAFSALFRRGVRRRVWQGIVGLMGFVLPGVPAARADVVVYLGYAENERIPIFYPNPWKGSPNTIFFGYDGPGFDAGAILIQNTGPNNVTLGPGAFVDSFTNGARFQLWDSYIGSGAVIKPGQNLILTQTAAEPGTGYSNFDTSDQPIQFVPDNAKPVIHLTLDGVAKTFTDTGQALNTGGYDTGNTLGRNESLQWRPVGTTGILYPGGTGISNTAVATYHNDNARTGQNLAETTLTRANVTPELFGKIFSYDVDGQIYAQPLHLSRVTVPNKGVHNIVYVATQHDSVYAFDADSNDGDNAAPLWKTSLIPSNGTSCPSDDICSANVSPEFGVTGTPVIDTVSGTLYVVGKTKESGAGGASLYVQRLHALDVATGAEKFGGPTIITASVTGAGEGNDGAGRVLFLPLQQFQRPALLLLNGVVYVAFASHCDYPPYHGWVIGYNATTLRQQGVYNTTPDAVTQNNLPAGAAIWQAGAGPAADSNSIYLETGNGTFNADRGGREYGDSFVKLRSSGNALTVADYFTPFNQDDLNQRDIDLGSSGPMVLPDQPGIHPHLLVGSSKEGKLYLVDRDNMGKFTAGRDAIVQVVNNAIGGAWSSPAYFNGAIYYNGVGDVMKAFSLSGGLLSTAPVAQSPVRFGYPGGTPSVSAEGNQNGILWAIENAGGQAVLHAYAADTLSELYNSRMVAGRDDAGGYLNFTLPMIANGKVFVGTRDKLVVYGGGFWTPAPIIAPNGGPFPGIVTVTITDAAPGAAIHYTTDGSFPTEASPLYSAPFQLNANTTVRARAYHRDFHPGAVAEATFTQKDGPVAYAINSGGGGDGLFSGDTLFDTGNTYATGATIDVSQVSNPAPQGVYQSERWGNFAYTLPNLLAGASYKVRLHFAEIYWDNPGQRRFNVLLNSQQVISDLDIFSVAGGKFKAIVREFISKADNNGKIKIEYVTIADNAKSSGIEIIPPATEVTSQTALTLMGHSVVGGVHTYTFRLTNNDKALSGPLYLALSNLPTGGKVLNAAGVTVQTPPAGSPYVLITSGGLASGATSPKFAVKINKPLTNAIAKRILTGPGLP